MKGIIITGIALFLIAVSVYSVNGYNKEKEKADSPAISSDNSSNTQDTSDNTTSNDTTNEASNDASYETTKETSKETSDDSLNNSANSNTDNTKADENAFDLKENAVKEAAEDFTLTDLEGNEVTLSDFKGKKVFLNFWATWCPPCRSEMPEIEKIYQETKDSDLVILAVEIGEPQDTVKTFIDDNKYNFKVLLDLDQSVATDYGISAIPTSFFIDENGNIVSKKIGAMSLEEMKENIQSLENQ